MTAPLKAGMVTSKQIGFFLVIVGVARGILALRAHSKLRIALGLTIGVLAIVWGIMILSDPLARLFSITLLLVIYLGIFGVSEILFGFRLRPRRDWGWMLFNGIVALLLAFLLWCQWPLSGLPAVGLMVGIHIFLNGVSMIASGLATHGGVGRAATV